MKAEKILYSLLLSVPLINTLSDSSVNYFSDNAFHIGIIRFGIIFLIIFILFVKGKVIKNSPNKIILFFGLYLLLLIPFSSDSRYSFIDGYLKWIPSMLMFPAAYYIFKTERQLLKLSSVFLISTVPVLTNYILAQYFNLGVTVYAEDSLYYGGASVGIANLLSISVLFSPFFFQYEKNKFKRIIGLLLVIASIVTILLVMKRAAIISLVLGFITYSFFMPNKTKMLKYVFIFILAGLIVINLFDSIFIPRYEARNIENRPIEEEGRFNEFYFAFDDFSEGNIIQKLFGSELFNSKQFFGVKYFGRNRMIHGDFTAIFHGSGLIGISLFLLLLYSFYIFNKINYKRSSKNYNKRLCYSLFNGILICFIIITMTGTGISVRSSSFLLLGAISGVLNNNLKSYRRIHKRI